MSGIPWMSYLFPLILMGAFLAFALYRWRTMSAGMEPGMRSFLERTGYRLQNTVDASVEASVQLWKQNWALQKSQGRYEVTMVRDYHGLPIMHHSFMGRETPTSNRYVISAWWRIGTPPPRVGFHVAERSLGGLGSRLKGMMTNMNRQFTQRYSVQVQCGDPDLDKRFQIYGVDEVSVRQALATPGLKEALLACAEVDLYVDTEAIAFNDPEQKNLRAAMGGMVGAMAIGGNMAKMMEVSIGAHEQISHLMALTYQATKA